MDLRKELTLLDVFCIASGAMISSGLFILPGIAHAVAGPAVVFSYFIAGLLAATGMLSQAELVSAMPKAGGTYFYVTRTLGPAVGTVDGLITWFSITLKSAFALVGMAAFARVLFDINMQAVATALCVFFVLVNLIGVKQASRTQVALVLGLLAVLVFYATRGFPEVRVQNLEPFAPGGTSAIFLTAGMVFVSYGGLLKVASIAEEIKDPGRTIPLAMILSLVIVGLLYMLVVLVTTGVLDANLLDHSPTPISDGAEAFMGRSGWIVMGIAALLAFISTANAGIMAASRYPLALSRDGLLPEFLRKIHPRFKTPYVSILITGGLMILALFMKLNTLVKAASTVLIITYTFSCLAVIILRESRIQNYRPRFRVPLYPAIQIVGVAGFMFLLYQMGRASLFSSLGIIGTGVVVYWVYGRGRTIREFALLHLIERITAKEITTRCLETELKDIIRERDDITKDRFDRVIEESMVLDIDETMDVEPFFKIVSEAMSGHLRLMPDDILHAIHEREKQSSTVLRPGLAIPHIVVEGEKTFDILLARSKGGVYFSEDAPHVHAIFVLVGTRDERNFHLRSLSAIAQIVQDPGFEEKWMAAESTEELRDIVLLGERRR
ncbi:MAG: amino acid permease [bacterium]|jgi:amino acid transporter/mannitol/fructose-specific phosphotransferase system IIA component (Ntr-type)